MVMVAGIQAPAAQNSTLPSAWTCAGSSTNVYNTAPTNWVTFSAVQPLSTISSIDMCRIQVIITQN
jgi:hypothetical protein